MQNIIELESFIKGFENLSPNERNLIFYHTLFDISSWEGNAWIEDFFPSLPEIKKVLKSILGKSDIFNRFSENVSDNNIDAFIQGTVFTDNLTKQILAIELDGEVSHEEHCDVKKGNIKIEIKRLSSALNLKEHIEELCNSKIPKDKQSKWILLLLFPIAKNENHLRFESIVIGFHSIEELLEKKTGCKVKIISRPVTLNIVDGKTSLEIIVEKLDNMIKGLK